MWARYILPLQTSSALAFDLKGFVLGFDKNFTGVEDAVGVEGLFDGEHDIKASTMFSGHVFGFADADAVFTCGRSPELDGFHDDEAIGFEGVLILDIPTKGKFDVDVAITSVTDHVAGDVALVTELLDIGDEFGVGTDRYGDIVDEEGFIGM